MIIIENSGSIPDEEGRQVRPGPLRSTILSHPKRTVISLLVLGAVLASTALAGGNMDCPDCPDWTNLDRWWAKYHSNPTPSATPATSATPQVQATANASSPPESDEEVEYPSPGLLTRPGDDLDGRVLLDARSPEDYEAGHLPGARNLYWRSLRSGGSLDLAAATDALRSLGVNETDPIVVYGNGDDSAYIFWALEYLGHENLSRLDGDISAFPDLELVQNAPEPTGSNYTPAVKERLLVNESMLALAEESFAVQIVDTRSSFSDYASSRISNSMLFETSNLFSDPEARTLKSAADLDELFSGRGLDEGKVQMIYGTPEACTLYFALRTMGHQAAVLDGDWWQDTDYATSSIS